MRYILINHLFGKKKKLPNLSRMMVIPPLKDGSESSERIENIFVIIKYP